jgi:hypothetical protein
VEDSEYDDFTLYVKASGLNLLDLLK